MTEGEDSALKQRLRAAVHYTVGKICDEEAASSNMMPSPHFIHALSELVYQQAEIMALDLECFSRHGRRTVISTEDVKLCARRNDSVHQILSGMSEQMKEEKSKKRKKPG
ncbi:uncharacterized protein SPPG_01088 [Spizellomyces punctatus DAOM BR117]|uniref:Centromere protein S n=1 Tax=Spizellomyces punctatus (strain DAOM BR117) TaxID=645134 RepID=A0A0L0HRB0_SPIPD|nr:uncharacterized protein SPPG_01088 [Spizellomyces punctatus DAOM BR117]KND03612.1 hypothetical protein SPPG_01088 [Spizellomyces punctatus DAOM BR117]|eukprot:XP_016611651.1 hypothetical protein SPPG_01088 [Spizellomyces punctatus DAOM BR117]